MAFTGILSLQKIPPSKARTLLALTRRDVNYLPFALAFLASTEGCLILEWQGFFNFIFKYSCYKWAKRYTFLAHLSPGKTMQFAESYCHRLAPLQMWVYAIDCSADWGGFHQWPTLLGLLQYSSRWMEPFICHFEVRLPAEKEKVDRPWRNRNRKLWLKLVNIHVVITFLMRCW